MTWVSAKLIVAFSSCIGSHLPEGPRVGKVDLGTLPMVVGGLVPPAVGAPEIREARQLVDWEDDLESLGAVWDGRRRGD